MIKNDYEPLVSIIVVTYNSAQFVLETLKSAKKQTYQNIELIITDDCSTDDTVKICKSWISENGFRFVDCKLLESKQNTGIAPNNNRGLYSANGEWIKFIAGDDILLDNCITDLINYTNKNNEAKVIFGKMKKLINDNLIDHKPSPFFYKSLDEQYKMVYTGSGIHAPASFINREFLLKLGGFDNEYPFLEDVPLWIKIAEAKVKFWICEKYVVVYRRHANNITSSMGSFINVKYYCSLKSLIINKIIPFVKKGKYYLVLFNLYNYLIIYDLILFMGNKNNLFAKILKLFYFVETKNSCIRFLKKIIIK